MAKLVLKLSGLTVTCFHFSILHSIGYADIFIYEAILIGLNFIGAGFYSCFSFSQLQFIQTIFFCIPGLLKESIDLIFSPQKEKTSQRKKSVTFQLPSEDKHVLALDFLSWIMVRMNPNHLLISLNNTKARRVALILMDSLYW